MRTVVRYVPPRVRGQPEAPGALPAVASTARSPSENGSPPAAVARVVRELDTQTAPHLAEELDELLVSGCVHVELDLSEVPTIC